MEENDCFINCAPKISYAVTRVATLGLSRSFPAQQSVREMGHGSEWMFHQLCLNDFSCLYKRSSPLGLRSSFPKHHFS